MGKDERPWSTFGADSVRLTLEKVLGIERPRVCPDCADERPLRERYRGGGDHVERPASTV
jgi:hypothetical protein